MPVDKHPTRYLRREAKQRDKGYRVTVWRVRVRGQRSEYISHFLMVLTEVLTTVSVIQDYINISKKEEEEEEKKCITCNAQ